MRAIEKGKKTFLLRTLAALVILAFCAVPMLASSPTYAGDKDSSSDSKDSSSGGGVTVDLAGDYTGSADCFTAKITPTTATAGAQDVAFILTYTHDGNHDSPKLVQFKTTIPSIFSDINKGINPLPTTAVSYDGATAYWTSVWTSPQIISTANNLDTDAICGSNTQSKRGWVQVTFTADVGLYVGYLDLTPDGGTRTAGDDFDVNVTAKKYGGTTITNYGGTVHFSSSDPYPADLPANYHFVPGNNGYKHFHDGVTLYTAGNQTITVSDPALCNVPFEFTTQGYKQDKDWVGGWLHGHWVYSIGGLDDLHGSQPTVTVTGPLTPDTETFTVNPGEAYSLDLEPNGPNTAISGVPFDVTVTLYDEWGNVATGYHGTVHFSSSDPLAVPGAGLPNPYPFTTGLGNDNGVHIFLNGVTLYTAGLQWVTAENCGGPPKPTPLTDTAYWTVTVPQVPVPTPTPPAEEEVAPLLETTTTPPPVLVVDMLGTIVRYPVTADGRLLVDAITTSPDGLVTLLIPRGTLVLNPNGTPAYLNKDPDVFSITAATPQPPAGYTMVAAYEFLPSGITFSPDANIIIKYDAAKVPAGMPVIAYYDEAAGKWTNLETAGYVAGGVEVPNTVQAHTAHLTYFAILAK